MATAAMARVTSVVGHRRSSISALTEISISPQAPCPSPNFTRVPIMEEIAAAVAAGAELKGVICEKPLGRNMAEARRLVDLAQSAGLRTAYFENQIFMKPVAAQLAQLAPVQRKMGPLSLTRSAEEHGGPHEGWFWDPTKRPYGLPPQSQTRALRYARSGRRRFLPDLRD